jgi:hypothetical protein
MCHPETGFLRVVFLHLLPAALHPAIGGEVFPSPHGTLLGTKASSCASYSPSSSLHLISVPSVLVLVSLTCTQVSVFDRDTSAPAQPQGGGC